MSFLRPAVLDQLYRHREGLAAAALTAFGFWVATRGGFVLLVAGLLILAIGIGWLVLALRSLRFAQKGEAPGIVQVSEGQVGYLGPQIGGFVGLPDLAEIRLLTLRGRRVWQLQPLQGPALHIPVEAAGAEALFDAFATLPGLDTAALVAALAAQAPGDGKVVALNAVSRVIWTRPGAGLVSR